MYSPLKHKQEDLPRPASYSGVRRIMPRHTKSYLWLLFLGFVFSLMLLSDNGFSIIDFLPGQRDSFSFDKSTAVIADHKLHPVNGGGLDASLWEKSTAVTAGHKSDASTVSTTASYSSVPTHTSTTETTGTTNSQERKPPVYGAGEKAFTPDDVVILFRTGATVLWRRVPMHLSTTFANKTMTPNVVFYSDQADSIAGQPIVDVLANVSNTLKQSADFELYRKLPSVRPSNQYLESGSMDGDHYLPGGWRLDKYKFLPLAAHAAAHHLGKKWYIFMEDDNYLFWHSLYTWLGANFSPSDPVLLGGPAAKLGEDFAHGGSGIIMSGAALSQTFGADPGLASRYEQYTVDHCCGDQVLSHVMAAGGVPRFRKYDDTSFVGLQALSTWKMAFAKWNWCSPLLNVHKAHQADLSRLHEFERAFHAERGFGSDAVMDWSYLFKRFVAGDIFQRQRQHNNSLASISYFVPDETVMVEEWDNLASEKWFSSDITVDESLSEAEREKKPWFSAKGCEEACLEWDLCLSWKFLDDNCGLSSSVSAGMKVDEGVKLVSGYMGKRIRQLIETPECGRSKYIPANT